MTVVDLNIFITISQQDKILILRVTKHIHVKQLARSQSRQYSGYSLIRNHVCGGHSFLITEFPHKRIDLKRKSIIFAVPISS